MRTSYVNVPQVMAEGRPERGSEKMEQMMSSINNMGCMMMQKGMDKGEFMQGSVARLANLSPYLAKLAKYGPPPAKFIFDFLV